MRAATRIVVALALAATAAVTALYVFGPPPFITRRLLSELECRGLVIRLRRLRLRLPFDIEARGVRVYAHTVAEAPLIEVDRAVGRLDPVGAWHGTGWLRGVGLSGGRLLPAVSEIPSDGRPVGAALDGLAADIEFEPDGWRVRHAEARLGAIWRASGRIVGASTRKGGERRPPEHWDRDLCAFAERWQAVARAMAVLDAPRPPVVRVTFDLDLNAPLRHEVEVAARGTDAHPWGLPPVAWRVRVGLRDGEWRLRQAEAIWDRGRVGLDATFRPSSREIEARLSGDMPLRDWLKLPLPLSVRRPMDRWNAVAQRVRIEAATDGYVPRDEAVRRLHGRVEIERGEVAEIPFRRLAANFHVENSRATFTPVEADIGTGTLGGPAEGWMTVHFEDGRFEGSWRSAFDPAFLHPLLTARQAESAASVVFLETPPRITVDFSGIVGRDDELRLRGRVEGENFVYNGSAVRRAEAEVALEAETLRLWNVVVEREEGRLTGRMEQRMLRREAEFEAVSTLSPPALARMISPFTHRLIQQFRFEGPVRIVGGGLATYEGRNDHDFVLEVEGERMGWQWLLADRLAFRLEALGRRIAFRDIRGEWHGGTVSGDVEIELTEPKDEPLRYRARGRIEDADFSEIMRDATDSDAADYSGRLTLEGQIEGELGEGLGRTAVGQGKVRLREGQLMRIPLFGGLSHWLSRLFPGLGFAAQDDFRADFTLADGVFHTENAQLRGSTISLRARGTYALSDDLRMIAEVRLLRSGLIADALRFLTSPVTRLLEFEVTGPLEQPRWTPRNLPLGAFK